MYYNVSEFAALLVWMNFGLSEPEGSLKSLRLVRFACFFSFAIDITTGTCFQQIRCSLLRIEGATLESQRVAAES